MGHDFLLADVGWRNRYCHLAAAHCTVMSPRLPGGTCGCLFQPWHTRTDSNLPPLCLCWPLGLCLRTTLDGPGNGLTDADTNSERSSHAMPPPTRGSGSDRSRIARSATDLSISCVANRTACTPA